MIASPKNIKSGLPVVAIITVLIVAANYFGIDTQNMLRIEITTEKGLISTAAKHHLSRAMAADSSPAHWHECFAAYSSIRPLISS